MKNSEFLDKKCARKLFATQRSLWQLMAKAETGWGMLTREVKKVSKGILHWEKNLPLFNKSLSVAPEMTWERVGSLLPIICRHSLLR